MAVGETKTVRIPAAEAYGERNKDMMQKVPVDQIPNGDQLPVGQTIYMMGQSASPSPCAPSRTASRRSTRTTSWRARI